jgi:serine/threonine protein kinase/tetratricopeptide (TPR) repeat protein
MSADPQKARAIFLDAVEKHAPEQWSAFLEEACGQDKELRLRVDVLLKAHSQANSLLDAPESNIVETIDDRHTEGPGMVIGPYKLLEQIGEGGFGVVFMAEQQQPIRRKVALKVLKPGMDTRQVVARFEAERQALAIMDHPNIAKVHDGGATSSGRPYFVMELVKGVPITEVCDQNQLTPRQRLELFLPVCLAVQHAHQKGIIHRDLKPSNVLVSRHDTTPIVKVIDFGVAKALGQTLTDKTLFTGIAQMIGTPLYMSPEQAGMSDLDIDTRSDIYSLGVLLYELLTGTTPFDKARLHQAGLDEIRRIIREEEPPKPSTRISTLGQAASTLSTQRKSDPRLLSQLFRGELDWIVMKALEKDRNRRYESASAFAADVQHYLQDQPVEACPPSAWYRFRKFSRRNKVALVAASVVAAALLTGTAVATWQAIVAMHARQEAERREAETRAVLEFVENKIFAAARPEGLGGGLDYDVKLADAIKAALPFVDKSFTTQPLIEARLRMTLGLSFWYLGDSESAIEQQVKARALYTEHGGPDHPDTLSSMHRLASSYEVAGRTQEALKLREETLQLRKAKLGPEHPDTLRSMNNLAESYRVNDRTQEALKLFEETLQLMKTKLGPHHPDTLASMMGLAHCYHTVGRTPEALKLNENTLQLYKAELGPNHPHTLSNMNSLAISYKTAGRTQEALKLWEETLTLQKAKLGPDHPGTLRSMYNLAVAYAEAGRTQEALNLHEETLPLRKAKLGPVHPDTLRSMNDLAVSYAKAARTQEALKLFEETLQLRKAKLGPEHPDTLMSINNLASSYCMAGRTQEALKLFEETLQLQKAKLGPHHPDTLMSMMNLAKGYANAGRTDEALKLHEETLQLKKAKLGPDHPDTLASMNNLASCYFTAGRTVEALKLREETLQLRKAKLGPDHPDTLVSMMNLSNSYHAAGRTQEALKLREETLQLMKANLGPDHPDTLKSIHNLAKSYIDGGEMAKAVAILQDTLTLRQRRVKTEPGNSVEQSFLGLTHGQLGEAEQSRLDYAAAVQAYARSVEIFEKLDQAGALKDPFFRGRLSDYHQRLALCQKAEQAVKDLDFVLKQPPPEVAGLLDLRVRFLLKEQKLPAAVESAAKMKEWAGDKAEQLYDAACAYALCAGAAKQAKSPADGDPGPEKLADEAMTLLKQAVAKGFMNAAHLKQDKDLDALSQRKDFKKLVAGLEAANKN